MTDFAIEWMIEGRRITKEIGEKFGVWLFLDGGGKVQFLEKDKEKADKAISEIFEVMSAWDAGPGGDILMSRFFSDKPSSLEKKPKSRYH